MCLRPHMQPVNSNSTELCLGQESWPSFLRVGSRLCVCARASAATRAGKAAMLKLTAKKCSFFGSVIVFGYSFSSPSIDYTCTCVDFFSSPSLFSSLPFAKSGLAKSPFGRPSAGGFLGRCRRCSRIFPGALVSPRYPLSVSDSPSRAPSLDCDD